MIKDIKETPSKFVLYYVSKQEAADQALMDAIQMECTEYKRQNYQPAIYISGDKDLEDCMYHLIKANRESMVTHPERFKGSHKWTKPNTDI